MRGVVYIERENTVGDRKIIRTLDVEGFSTSTDVMEIIKKFTHETLVDPEEASYTVRAIHDDGWRTRTIYRESYAL